MHQKRCKGGRVVKGAVLDCTLNGREGEGGRGGGWGGGAMYDGDTLQQMDKGERFEVFGLFVFGLFAFLCWWNVFWNIMAEFSDCMEEILEPSLQNIIDQESLKVRSSAGSGCWQGGQGWLIIQG